MSKIGSRIKMRRLQLDMSQEELAKKMGYKTRSSINKIESGRNDVSQSKIEAFAKALDTTPAYLMGWEDKIVPIAIMNEYRQRLEELLLSVDNADIEAAGIDQQKLSDVIEGRRDLTFNELGTLADELGISFDDLLLNLLGVESGQEKKPAVPEGDELSAKKRALIEKIKRLDESNVDIVAATADALIDQQEK